MTGSHRRANGATFYQFAFRYYGNTHADATCAFIWRRCLPQ
jgi:hypothetical protein